MKTQTELNADTLYAFKMALKGHKQFEFQHTDGSWSCTSIVSSSSPCRIYHDIPEGWTRHDGEEWKGDKDVVIQEVMFCSGQILREERTAEYWSCKYGLNNFTEAESHEDRIYAYKLAAKSPEIPEKPFAAEKLALSQGKTIKYRWGGDRDWTDIAEPKWTHGVSYRVKPVLEKKVIPWTWTETPLEGLRVKRKRDGKNFNARFQVDGVLTIGGIHESVGKLSYETLATDYLQLDGSICGKEVGQ